MRGQRASNDKWGQKSGHSAFFLSTLPRDLVSTSTRYTTINCPKKHYNTPPIRYEGLDIDTLQHVSMSKHIRCMNTYGPLVIAMSYPPLSTLLTSIPLGLRIRKRHLPLLTRGPLENRAVYIFETIIPSPTDTKLISLNISNPTNLCNLRGKPAFTPTVEPVRECVLIPDDGLVEEEGFAPVVCVQADVGTAVMARQGVAAVVWFWNRSRGRGVWEGKGCWKQREEQGEKHC